MIRTRNGPGFWATVFVLLRAARLRAAGRIRRQMRRNHVLGGNAALAPTAGFVLMCGLAGLLNLTAAFDIKTAVPIAEQVQAETNGRLVVEEWFARDIARHEANAARLPARRAQITRLEDHDITVEASRLARGSDGNADDIAARLRATVRSRPDALLTAASAGQQPGALPDIIVLAALLWWALMLVCQGEGPDLDLHRVRHPMWEWLFSHPAPPGAIFLADMIAPIAANPMYVMAPALPASLYGGIYGPAMGAAAAVLVGLPVTVALACAGKALEIWAVLRLSPRGRGAVLGVMGWFGFISMLPIFLVASSAPQVARAVSLWLAPLSHLPWPPVRRLAGLTATGDAVFWQGVAACWTLAAVLILAAVALAVASTRGGVTGRSESRRLAAGVAAPVRFGREPLYWKELLWLRRDRTALVQAVLMPLSLAAIQVVNLRGFFAHGDNSWSTPCGIAVLFGTYFLIVLGPKSLASEGRALWIALTWPLGLESLLRAKARLWTTIASTFVAMALVYAALRHPADIGKVLIVAVLWWVFARSLADKTTTLATSVSASGDPEKPPAGLRWAAVLGTMTFSLGIFTQQWGLAIAGVVYSIVTAAAMWQNFRYRLPFLWDPWSQRLPPPPTLLHAMIGISCMVEAVAVLSAAALAIAGRDRIAPINAGLYALCAIAAAGGISMFLADRGVSQRDIWLWRGDDRPRVPAWHATGTSRVILVVAAAAVLGAALGGAAHVYLFVLHAFPDMAMLIDAAQRQMDAVPDGRAAYAVMAVAFAPFAEEFLFRGLLYRALDREWGGWRAVLGAAAFFAVYHPALSWLPVAALGAMNAVLYKRTGLLAPAVAAHMAYNAVVVAF